MADMYSTANTLANDMTLYTTLQGITMQLLILRLIKVLSAQKRLSILTTTAIKVTALLLFSEMLSVLTTCDQLDNSIPCRLNVGLPEPR